jgi:hypothetical protein
MLPTLSSAFMTAARMDGFSYVDLRARQPKPGRSALARLWTALFAPSHRRA